MPAAQIKKAGRCPLQILKKCSPACQESFVEDALSVFFSVVSVLASAVLLSAGFAVLWFLPA